MALDKQLIRKALAPMVGPYQIITTTSGGAAGGGDFISTELTGKQNGFYRGWWALINGGTHIAKYRYVSEWTSSTVTGTIVPALGSAVATALEIELLPWKPTTYTTAMRRAIRHGHKWGLFLRAIDSSISLTAGDYKYTMPSGVTPEMVKRVMFEGDGNFDETPRHELNDFSFNPDDTEIWLNRNNPNFYHEVTTGRKLYLFLHKYLTPVAADAAEGALTTDTTDLVELSENTSQYELFLLFCKAFFFDTVMPLVDSAHRQEYKDMRDEALAFAEGQSEILGFRPVEQPFAWS